jgi:hypothetical protein
LLKLHGQPLAQRVVKHRIAGLVLESPRGQSCPCR